MEHSLNGAITKEERQQALDQTILMLKNRYLQFKSEYISSTALGNTKMAQEMAKRMEECETSYKALMKEGL